jgi:hypothetical protein
VAVARAAELAKLGAMGVRAASSLTAPADENTADRILPAHPALRDILPGHGLVRGTTIAVGAAGVGATSLLLALLAGASSAGATCAAVGVRELSLAAAEEAGIALDRLAMVERPGPDPGPVAAALIDGFELVILASTEKITAALCSQLSARARAAGTVLVVTAVGWPGAALTLTSHGGIWHSRGRFRCRQLTVSIAGRGAGPVPRRHQIWLPADPDFQATLPADAAAPARLRVVR